MTDYICKLIVKSPSYSAIVLENTRLYRRTRTYSDIDIADSLQLNINWNRRFTVFVPTNH